MYIYICVYMYICIYYPSLIIYDFLEVPWGLGRLPWDVPGGGTGAISAAQNVASPLGFGVVFYDDFDIDF